MDDTLWRTYAVVGNHICQVCHADNGWWVRVAEMRHKPRRQVRTGPPESLTDEEGERLRERARRWWAAFEEKKNKQRELFPQEGEGQGEHG